MDTEEVEIGVGTESQIYKGILFLILLFPVNRAVNNKIKNYTNIKCPSSSLCSGPV